MSPNTPRYQAYTLKDLNTIPQLSALSNSEIESMRIVAQILPFRVNNYVVDQLINWDDLDQDPIFRLTFPHRDMLPPALFDQMLRATRRGDSKDELKRLANDIRHQLNPHPASQMSMNVPVDEGSEVPGVQRKYRETCLVFPSQGQTCHAYCSFCFRWPQFIGDSSLRFATDEAQRFATFIRKEKSLTDVLITGGDPMVMRTDVLKRYIETFLQPGFEHIQNIRIGTKALTYWPYRFVSDKDSDELLKLFEQVHSAGKHLALMAHVNHVNELKTDICRTAIRRIRSTGAEIRAQSPLIRGINDTPDAWSSLWEEEVRLGVIPYYMFVERPTGAFNHFEVPLAKCLNIFQTAYRQVSGLARTVRGPSMSASPGKVVIDGVTTINNEKVFVCSMIQAREPEWARQPFFAKYDEKAVWLDDLKPAFGDSFFFQATKEQPDTKHLRVLNPPTATLI